MTKNKNDLQDLRNTKKIVAVVVIVVITGIFLFNNELINPIMAKSSKSEDKTAKSTDKKSNSAGGTATTATTSSSVEQNDYKNFQKCLSTAANAKGFDTKTDIENCFKPIYSPATASSTGTNSSSSSSSIA
jgi:hypothetical protein